MGFKESSIEREITLETSKTGTRLFRNNVGKAWAGNKYERINQTDVIIRNARILHAGLCKGSSDRIGWNPVKITPDMVGKTVAVFTAVEVKTNKGRSSIHQDRFLQAVRKSGGYGILGRCKQQVLDELAVFPGVEIF